MTRLWPVDSQARCFAEKRRLKEYDLQAGKSSRQIELITIPDVEHRRSKDIGSGLFPYDNCESRVLRELRSNSPALIVHSLTSTSPGPWKSCLPRLPATRRRQMLRSMEKRSRLPISS